MYRTRITAAAALLLTLSMPVFATSMETQKSGPQAMAATPDYRFALAGPPKAAGAGKSIVSIKLVHSGKLVTGAIIIQSRADMGPEGMAMMAAPLKPLPASVPGIYSFEVQNGSVWNKPGKFALTLTAKVHGEPQTVRGSVIVQLTP
jgi:hypothetical protein